MNRGAIVNEARSKQLNDFTGLRYGSITPSDIDGLMDFHDKGFAFLELKLDGAPVSTGQGLAFKRVVDRIEKSGALAALFVSDHWVRDPDQQVDAARSLVRWIYQRGRVTEYDHALTLRQAVDRFYESIQARELCQG